MVCLGLILHGWSKDRPTARCTILYIKKKGSISNGNASDDLVAVPGIVRGKNLHLT